MPAIRQRYRPAPGWASVRITCRNPKTDVSVMLGEGAAKLTGGFGGWDVTARPQQVGMTTWSGVEPFTLEIPLMFEGFGWTGKAWGAPDGVAMNRDIYSLMRVSRGDEETPPGIVRVAGLVLPADRWVVSGLEFGDSIVRPSDKRTVRQAATLTLLEYVPPHYVRVAKRALQSPKVKTRIYVIKKGDTPAKIARKVRCQWKELRGLNPKKIPNKANADLRDGAKIRVPVEPTKGHKRSKGQSGKQRHNKPTGRATRGSGLT